MLILILSLSIIAVVQALLFNLYVDFVVKMEDPIKLKDRVIVWLIWLALCLIMCALILAGIKVVSHSKVEIDKAVAIIPIAIAFLFSLAKKKESWKAFSLKFKKK